MALPRRTFSTGLLAPFVLLLAACGAGEAPRPKNLLFVVFDTTRADRLSSYGNAELTTPVVDTIAENGVRFENAYAGSSLTPVSAGTFFTGRPPFEHGIRSLFNVNGQALAPEAVTLAERLAAEGMRTAGFVSAVPMSDRYGLDRGFETYSDEFGAKEKSPCGNEYQRRADETTDLALDWLNGNGLDPFFLFVHFFDAHDANLSPPRDWLEARVSFPLPKNVERPCALMGLPDEAKRELYDAELAWMDAQLGRLVARLERLGVLNETLIVLIADHGEALGDHGLWTHGWLYEHQLRVPLVMAGPGLPQGVVETTRVRLADLPVTVGDLFGVNARVSGKPMTHGRSFGGLFGENAEDARSDRPVYAEVQHSIEDRLRRDPRMHVLIDGDWKYVHRPATGLHELYDLANDPAEAVNRWAPDHPKASYLREWLESVGALGEVRPISSADLPPEELDVLQKLGYADDGSPDDGSSE